MLKASELRSYRCVAAGPGPGHRGESEAGDEGCGGAYAINAGPCAYLVIDVVRPLKFPNLCLQFTQSITIPLRWQPHMEP